MGLQQEKSRLLYFCLIVLSKYSYYLRGKFTKAAFLKAISYLDQESSQQQGVLYMAGVISCGFVRVAVKQSLLKSNGAVERDSQQRYENFKKAFAGRFQNNFQLDYKCYLKKSKDLATVFNSWKHLEDKKEYNKHFSSTKWNSLPQIQKQQHTLKDCKACMTHHFAVHSTFPVKFKNLKFQSPLKNLQDVTNCLKVHKNCKRKVNVKPTKL